MLYLARHCQTDWNREPARCQGWAETELNETGRGQARDLGRALEDRGIELIVTSHLVRARETARIVHEMLGARLPLIVDPRLAESHRGEWETRRFSSIIRNQPETWAHYHEHPETFRFPGGESLAAQQRRVLACLRDCVLDGRTALLVTHGGSIRLVRCFLDGKGIEAFHTATTTPGELHEIVTERLAEDIASYLEKS
ncbi:MAG: histidine phosphatase family protein [Actinobacteria bacterium]|nr:histidine phosphatase family protein [Actinomycetota bacterium]